MEDQKTWSGMLRRERTEKRPGMAEVAAYKAIDIRTAKDYNPAQEALLRYAAKSKSRLTIRKAEMLTEAQRAEKRRKLLILVLRELANN